MSFGVRRGGHTKALGTGDGETGPGAPTPSLAAASPGLRRYAPARMSRNAPGRENSYAETSYKSIIKTKSKPKWKRVHAQEGQDDGSVSIALDSPAALVVGKLGEALGLKPVRPVYRKVLCLILESRNFSFCLEFTYEHIRLSPQHGAGQGRPLWEQPALAKAQRREGFLGEERSREANLCPLPAPSRLRARFLGPEWPDPHCSGPQSPRGAGEAPVRTRPPPPPQPKLSARPGTCTGVGCRASGVS